MRGARARAGSPARAWRCHRRHSRARRRRAGRVRRTRRRRGPVAGRCGCSSLPHGELWPCPLGERRIAPPPMERPEPRSLGGRSGGRNSARSRESRSDSGPTRPRSGCARTVRGVAGAASRDVLDPAVAPSGLGYPPPVADDVRIRPMTELDIEGITRIDERITRAYRPEVWERRVGYYIPRDAAPSPGGGGGGEGARVLLGAGPGGADAASAPHPPGGDL